MIDPIGQVGDKRCFNASGYHPDTEIVMTVESPLARCVITKDRTGQYIKAAEAIKEFMEFTKCQ